MMKESIHFMQSGRSMVEMLGVLAVVGVLSIGGVVGYKYAMEKNMVNGLLNAASQLYIVGGARIDVDHDWCAELGSIDLEQAGLPYPDGAPQDVYIEMACDNRIVWIEYLDQKTYDALIVTAFNADLDLSNCVSGNCSLALDFSEN